MQERESLRRGRAKFAFWLCGLPVLAMEGDIRKADEGIEFGNGICVTGMSFHVKVVGMQGWFHDLLG
jgi:hypothetical protein